MMIQVFIKIKKKEMLPLIIYTIFLGIYIVFHDINILKFNTDIYINSSINIIRESYGDNTYNSAIPIPITKEIAILLEQNNTKKR